MKTLMQEDRLMISCNYIRSHTHSPKLPSCNDFKPFRKPECVPSARQIHVHNTIQVSLPKLIFDQRQFITNDIRAGSRESSACKARAHTGNLHKTLYKYLTLIKHYK